MGEEGDLIITKVEVGYIIKYFEEGGARRDGKGEGGGRRTTFHNAKFTISILYD